MPYEYKVVPAPARGQKAKGLKTTESRFCNALETLMNSLAAEGWSYLRADTLPSEERQGLTGSQTVYRSVLVFQRRVDPPAEDAPAAPSVEAASPPLSDTAPMPQIPRDEDAAARDHPVATDRPRD